MIGVLWFLTVLFIAWFASETGINLPIVAMVGVAFFVVLGWIARYFNRIFKQ